MKLIAEIEGRRQEFLLHEGVNVIGRDLDCDVTLLSSSLSRRHAVCTVQGQRIFVRDLGSRNGTFLGEDRIQEAEVRPGDAVRFGQVAVRFSLGGPAGVAPSAPAPEMAREILPPKGAHPMPAEEPTPVDIAFAPEAPGTGEAGALAAPAQSPVAPAGLPARIEEQVASAPVEAVAGAAAAGRRPLSRRERLVFIVPAAAALVVVLAVLLGGFRRPAPPKDVLSSQEYNRRIDQLVQAYREGARDAAQEQLTLLVRQKVQGDPETASIFAEALRAERGLGDPARFAEDWLKARERWDELKEYSRATPAARDLAAERLAAIARESQNMDVYEAFQRLYAEGRLEEARRTAARMPEDSIFYPLIRERAEEARARLLQDAQARARQAMERGRWKDAVDAFAEVEALLGAAPPEVVAEKNRAQRNLEDEQRIAQAARFIDQGEEERARNLLALVSRDGPYAQRVVELEGRIKTADVRRRAVALYNSKRADEALQILADAGLAGDPLSVRIREVRDLWEKVEAASKVNDFQTARSHCAAIVAKESDPNNRYRLDADRYIQDAPALQKALAEETRRRGVKAREEGDYRRARDLFEEARQIDPQGQIGRSDVDALIAEAGRQFNHALNIRDREPKEALRILREVRDRLRLGDPYYDRTLEEIKRLESN